MRNILIIEDDKEKIRRLIRLFENDKVTVKESFQTGVAELKKNAGTFDFLILDMTIPLWEKGNNDLGGNYEQFGGEKILREIKRKKLFVPTLMFTMFDIFPTQNGTLTHQEIDAIFKQQFQDFFIGSVLFTSDDDSWEIEMGQLMAQHQ